ncbi:hypothetical protein [Actinomadura kijaniata]|uniref:hypothetical protein n=1 Tax=Actinomadura kijaniata TaxID=46161 RepID=UPI000836D5A1|nr:hypothetical protein [Actinomadura kijaniata]
MIVQRGVNHDTEREVWDVAYVRRDMAAIRDDLHCDSVIPLGSSLRDGIVRDEREQARYLDELLDVFEAENAHGAFVHGFVAPGSPTAADPRYDLDTASFSLLKVASPGSPDDCARTGRWEPKAAFHTVAARSARPGGSTLSEVLENQQL